MVYNGGGNISDGHFLDLLWTILDVVRVNNDIFNLKFGKYIEEKVYLIWKSNIEVIAELTEASVLRKKFR